MNLVIVNVNNSMENFESMEMNSNLSMEINSNVSMEMNCNVTMKKYSGPHNRKVSSAMIFKKKIEITTINADG